MRKSVFCCIAVSVLATASCVKDSQPDLQNVSGKEITLSLGFEEQTSIMNPNAVQTKTYLNSKRQMLWGTSAGDKVIYVFDTKGNKNGFDGSEGAAANQLTRTFKGTISPDSEVDYVIWTGQTTDECVLNNGVFSGTTLKVLDYQKIDNANSFAQTANVAVMKPGDKVLRNVFGYIQYILPEGIESVTFTAAENLAGLVEIDYSGENPTATLLDNGASKSILVKTKYKNNIYEAGTYYAVLPAGTYTNFTITVKPVEGEAFTLPVTDDVVIVRGKFTSAGTLPATAPEQTDPTPDPEPEPEPEPDDSNWPKDETAFDYGLTGPKTANPYYEGLANGYEFADNYIYTVDKISYCGKGWYKGTEKGCWMINTCYNFTSGTGGVLPDKRYISFKINKPGELSFFPRHNSSATPAIVVTVVYKKNGSQSFKNLYYGGPTTRSQDENDKENPDCRVKVSVSEELLSGIDEAATVYVFHRKDANDSQCNIDYYPFTWTPAN